MTTTTAARSAPRTAAEATALAIELTEIATYKPTLAERQRAAETAFPRLHKRSYALAPWMLKSGLFPPATGPRVEYTEPTEVPAHPGYTVSLKGPELRQDDGRVLLALLKLAAGKDVAISLRISPRSFCQQIGWPDSSDSVPKLRDCIKRLHAVRVLVKTGKLDMEDGYSFISDFHSERGEITVWLSPRLLEMYRDHMTYIDVKTRCSMRDGLTSWLYGYILADACYSEIPLPLLLAMSGLWTYEQKAFNRRLRASLDELQALSAVRSWSMSGATVKINKA